MLTVFTSGILKRIFKICIYLCKKKQKSFPLFFLHQQGSKSSQPPSAFNLFPIKEISVLGAYYPFNLQEGKFSF
jgi:hypothetical protein